MTKTYNVGAHGIPNAALVYIAKTPIPLRYSLHSMTEALQDRYGRLDPSAFPRVLNLLDGWEVIEVMTENDRVLKFVVRRPVDARRSLVLVVLSNGFVLTLWTNLNTDKHATLDKSKFDRP